MQSSGDSPGARAFEREPRSGYVLRACVCNRAFDTIAPAGSLSFANSMVSKRVRANSASCEASYVDRRPGDRRLRLDVLSALAFLAVAAAGCRTASERPSIVLAVLDTVRADAVSAYGAVTGTTPTVDALASRGLLYEHAYANANWTVPSHASIFTGRLPREHGLVTGNETLGSIPTMAELLRSAGYETVGMSENPWLVTKGGINRGFEVARLTDGDLVGMVSEWARDRKRDRPFFLFVNLMDAHIPYKVTEATTANPFLPAGVTLTELRELEQLPTGYVCDVKPDDRAMALLRALYLTGVHAADDKLARILAALDADRSGNVITIVTSDHGEYLGEHWRVGHVIGVHETVLRVPLVVHGLPKVSPGRIAAPVQMIDLLPSILDWTGTQAPAGLAGMPLPTTQPQHGRKTSIIAEYSDYFRVNRHMPGFLVSLKTNMDKRCTPEHRMFGDMQAIIRYPHKLVWYSDYPSQIFDLERDPGEERDLMSSLSQVAAELRAELSPAVSAAQGDSPAAGPTLAPSDVERLRALGYFDHADH